MNLWFQRVIGLKERTVTLDKPWRDLLHKVLLVDVVRQQFDPFHADFAKGGPRRCSQQEAHQRGDAVAVTREA